MKKIDPKIQETQHSSRKMNASTPRNIINLYKISDKENNLKNNERKRYVAYRGAKMTADFLWETKVRRQ